MIHNILKNKKVVLASASPRRKELLELVGVKFIQMPADVDETILPSDHINPKRYAKRIALKKCDIMSKANNPDCLVISADTIVYLEKTILGKPKDYDEVYQFLNKLSGKSHIVYTAVAIAYNEKIIVDVAKTYVSFKNLQTDEIRQYIETGEPMDKAGAYGIQGFGSQFIEKITGCYFNVMGFPVNLFLNMLKGLL